MVNRCAGLLLITLAGAVVAACTGPIAGAQTAEPTLGWQGCSDGAVDCATLSVPVDHDRPDGERLDIAVARLPANDPDTRRGTIVFHPGGPGPALKAFLEPGLRSAFAELTQWFDVVTFDSRGYGQSNPVCDVALAPPFVLLDSPAAYAEHQERVRAYGESCRADHPTLAEHASAEDVAHDIDMIRAALGEEQILFYGNSYGTVFGQEYAEHHGDRLQRLYLDSVADHTSPPIEESADSAEITESMLHRFADRCSADPGCPLRGHRPLEVWDEVMAAAEHRPIPTGDGRELTANYIRLATPLHAELRYEQFATALAQAHGGDYAGLVALLGPAAAALQAATMDAGQLTNCLDFPGGTSYGELQTVLMERRERAPRLGWLPTLDDWRCAGWPIGATNEPAPLHAPDAPPALVVNSTVDPATHIIGAQHVTDQISGSALLAVSGFTHAIYMGQPDNRCVRDVVHRYLLDGELPEPGSRCASTRLVQPRP